MGLCDNDYDIKPFLSKFGKKLKKFNRIMESEALDPQDTLRSIRARIIAKGNSAWLEALDATIKDQFKNIADAVLNDQNLSYERFLPSSAQQTLKIAGDEFTDMYSISKEVDSSTMEDSEGSTGDLQGTFWSVVDDSNSDISWTEVHQAA